MLKYLFILKMVKLNKSVKCSLTMCFISFPYSATGALAIPNPLLAIKHDKHYIWLCLEQVMGRTIDESYMCNRGNRKHNNGESQSFKML